MLIDDPPRSPVAVGHSRLNASDLASRLAALTEDDAEFWAFAANDERDYTHGLLHYPAMMVPRLQRRLMETCIEWDPSIRTVLDPFVGSGTVMTETMLLGRDFVGSDVNPLAILACRAKSEHFDAEDLEKDLRRLLTAVRRDPSSELAVTFTNRDKWFNADVAVGLSKLRRAIEKRPLATSRRFWWVALAETVRLTSNSRTSTVKLHIRPEKQLARRPDPVERFSAIASRNVGVLQDQQRLLRERGFLHGTKYSGRVKVNIGDARDGFDQLVDMVVTSPPYGDNQSTVTYGQASYLPLQWIAHKDISRHDGRNWIRTTHAIDTMSLGGSRRDAHSGVRDVLDKSPSLVKVMSGLQDHPRDRGVRVAAFYRDLDAALTRICEAVRSDGLLVWTVGDRMVGGQRVPLAQILPELVSDHVDLVTTLDRRIPAASKRMPSRNAIASTMGTETILVLRKKAQP